MSLLSRLAVQAARAYGILSSNPNNVPASYLSVAGGGGGAAGGGGGGAGGLLTSTFTLSTLNTYSITVGAGGLGGVAGGTGQGANGSNSVISGTGLSTITSIGGGGTLSAGGVGNSGGSGGGGGSNDFGANSAGGAGTAGQGNNGGASFSTGQRSGGGGGGASAVGNTGTSTAGGAGGAGTASSISGSSVTYAGGGGGGAYTPNATVGGAGGAGGGGAGSGNGTTNGTAGTTNLGGGGGAGGATSGVGYGNGGNGGSGVVIISYASATPRFVGGTLTTSGGNQIHTFTSSGTLSPLTPVTASYLVVAGGGGAAGNRNGGGGAGGLLTSSTTLYSGATYIVTVGAGGAGGAGNAGPTSAQDGSNSVLSGTGLTTLTAIGGGGGGGTNNPSNGRAGGSGGGGGGDNAAGATGGAGTSGQGNAGGTPATGGGAGGGGASAVGANGASNTGGNGGAGTASSITGTSVTYAGGGGGGATTTAGTGGAGGGGNGAQGSPTTQLAGVSGTQNLGGGAGGGSNYGSTPVTQASGGSGIVIISYAGSQVFNGGLVTSSGGNTIHTFTSSGALTPLTNNLTNSLRFRASASAYLNRTFGTPTNNRIFTWSGWVKRGSISTSSPQNLFRTGAANSTGFRFSDTSIDGNMDGIRFFFENGTTGDLKTTQVFRDPSAWYHLVVAVDTTQATAANRVKLYINGNQITAFSTASYPAQNYIPQLNSAVAHSMGIYLTGVVEPFDGYMDDINFIDGQALEPYYFGNNDANGVWKPILYKGTYGTNGFYLPFIPNTVAGYSSNYGSFNGSSQYLSISSCSATNFGTGNYTVEAWVYQNSRSDIQFVIGGSSTCFQCYINTNGQLVAGLAGSGDATASTGTVSLGMWTYVAWVRTGVSLTYYINGIASGTVNDVFNYSLGSTTVNIATSNNNIGSYDLNGNMSNLRVVKGTAVYSANFTPPTSNLTAITNTSLLTLQNATIIDNSTNAWSITNTGSVTMTSATVGTYSLIANDASPNGNNWTPNNINAITAGTTYDAMLDVPTNTSATVANYCTLNPLPYYGGFSVLSRGNLQFTSGNSNWMRAFATIAVSSGKWYWEVTANNTLSQMHGISNVTNPSFYVGATNWVGYDATGYAYFSDDGSKWNNNASVAYGASWGAGDIIGIAFDADNGKLYFSKNGTFQASGDPAAGTNAAFTGLTSGPYVPAVSVATTSGANTCDANFGQRPFSYTPPTGFVALNTFNLPTPTILQGNRFMDATLATGNNSTQVIVNQGQFRPDFVWLKIRSGVENHIAYDSVRGAQQYLVPNLTLAEATLSTGLTSFNSNGFTLGNANPNYSGSPTFVGWQWQAGQGSTSSNTSGSITSTVSVNATAGFSVVTYTSQASGSATFGHGLGVAPSMIFLKGRNVAGGWYVYHSALGGTKYLALQSTGAATTAADGWNNTNPTSTLVTVGNGYAGGYNMVAYCWAEIAGFSAFGSYTGNGSTDGPFQYCGFRPRWIMWKRTSSTSSWVIWDTARNTYNAANSVLFPDASDAESTNTAYDIDVLSNGFKMRTSNATMNGSGSTYIYATFAENPFKNANAR